MGLVTTIVVSIGLGALIRVSGAGGVLVLSLPNFISVIVGALVAGWTAGRIGAIHGTILAAVYILISGAFNLAAEVGLVRQGTALLLPPMNMVGLLVSDVILLSGAALAGALGDGLSRAMSKMGRIVDDHST